MVTRASRATLSGVPALTMSGTGSGPDCANPGWPIPKLSAISPRPASFCTRLVSTMVLTLCAGSFILTAIALIPPINDAQQLSISLPEAAWWQHRHAELIQLHLQVLPEVGKRHAQRVQHGVVHPGD